MTPRKGHVSPNLQGCGMTAPKATYYRCPWSSVVGTGVFRKRSDQPNDFLIITVALPKAEAEETADAIVEMLTKREVEQ